MSDTDQTAASSEDVIVVVSSCDAYSDAWPPFVELFDRYWPDCPWPVSWIGNEQTIEHPRIQPFPVGEDRGWASNLLALLDERQPQSIIYLQEDYYLQTPVDSKLLQSVVDFGRQSGVGFIRLAGTPEPDLPFENPFGLQELSRGLKFRCSLQAAWWDTAVLRELLVPGENGWQMEIDGSRRSDALPQPFLATPSDRPLLDYFRETAILKGKWMPGALALCRREGIRVDTGHRPVHPRLPLLLKKLRKSRFVSSVRELFRT
ncbi:MAG: hypothetical protein ACYTGL_01300 [Planctomycetota bacterium]|jgi:hypothetical protein